uniref:Uncharacterized protein n=1 Tax=Anguilla anguilla TaxID=7936 RepID=A0A0E9XXU7_ANGAN
MLMYLCMHCLQVNTQHASCRMDTANECCFELCCVASNTGKPENSLLRA